MIFASLLALVQAFFTDRLLRQRDASPHALVGYRDSFRLLLNFASRRLGKAPSDLLIEDVGGPFAGAFLQHLETDRGNSARTRNRRLAAIHSFFHYVALTEPAHALICQRIASRTFFARYLALRAKPLTRFGVCYLMGKYAQPARSAAPSLARERVHPHTLRHSTAVHLLQAGVDLVSISHWLGHAGVETTNPYAVVGLETKRAAIRSGRFHR